MGQVKDFAGFYNQAIRVADASGEALCIVLVILSLKLNTRKYSEEIHLDLDLEINEIKSFIRGLGIKSWRLNIRILS